MWSLDVAREQSLSYEHFRNFCQLSLDSGFNALGIYLEHRFAYPSIPWVHGQGGMTPEMISRARAEFPALQLIPFINLLGHMEGFLYTEAGSHLAESRFRGMQGCPSSAEFMALCERLLDDVLTAFDSEIIHLGGDETQQLGECPKCAARVAAYEEVKGVDGKARLYGEHFGTLARTVVAAGRRPAVWGDMFVQHPTALTFIPKETLIFDWQYFQSPTDTARPFIESGYDTVLCPTLHTYNATWLHLPQSEENVRQHRTAAHALDAFGVCVTTWECALFGNYETILPAIRASGKMLSEESDEPAEPSANEMDRYRALREAPTFLRAYLDEGERYEEWARLMGVELQDAGGTFAFGGIRSAIKCRMLLYSNPFLLWLHHREELCGQVGDKALDVCMRAASVAPDAATRGVAEFGIAAVEFVRDAERAHQAYAKGNVGEAVGALSPCRQIFENLARTAKTTHHRIGGSLADIERCHIAREHVDRVIKRVRHYGDGSLGYLPSFEMLTHPKFVPHDQAGWWLINRWANE
jgi:hypothetical protein